jgi:hypothetical protein
VLVLHGPEVYYSKSNAHRKLLHIMATSPAE